ncbi:RNA polymerase sigma factor [Sanyastnella coralliicola]|uniref:RNA polymerase sigma factor n=1 Tax=Sanyastnella coralliicola TaxID=3069118 RepID=UPI0027B89E80|nr:sigma-70 family RNA polymerase sigma factor [Longitalea sp. SCSIO 12813]
MRAKQIPDRELVRSYIAGKDEAFEILLNRHRQQVFTKIFMLVKDHDVANDIFQDTFIKVINTLRSGRYNEEGKFLPWVLRIAHNLSIDHFRKGRKMPAVRSDENNDVFATIQNDEMHVEDQMVWDQTLNDVKSLLQYLPEEQREVVLMRHYYGMSFKEIAETNDISINTALGRMRYALINLRKIMEKNNIVLTLD